MPWERFNRSKIQREGRESGDPLHEIPTERLRYHPDWIIAARLRRKLLRHHRSPRVPETWIERSFLGSRTASSGRYAMSVASTGLEFLADREGSVLEQMSCPQVANRQLLAEEQSRFPGWSSEVAQASTNWERRMESEWMLATRIIAPAAHVVESCVASGAPRDRFNIVPYPSSIDIPLGTGDCDHPSNEAQALVRVLIVGRLSLLKGIQYLCQAFPNGPPIGAVFDFVGPSLLSPEGLCQVQSLGRVHGRLERTALHRVMANADIIVSASLSEGSSLSLREAAMMGTAVVATRESGAPAGSVLVDKRDPRRSRVGNSRVG